MSRNRYAKIVHKEQRARVAAQEKELQAIARRLRRPAQNITVLPESETKQRRRVRLERRWLDKPARYAITVISSQSSPTTAGTTDGIAA